MPPAEKSWIYLGRVGRPHGVRGELRLTLPAGMGASLGPGVGVLLKLGDEREEHVIESLRGDLEKGAVLRLRGVQGRAAAARLTNAELLIARDSLPPLGKDEFYFADVEGARVSDPSGAALGTVTGVWEGGGGLYFVCDTPKGEAYLPVRAAAEIAPARGAVTADPAALIYPEEPEELEEPEEVEE